MPLLDDTHPEPEAVESFDEISKKYTEYLNISESIHSPEMLIETQAQIAGHLFFIAKPLAYHLRMSKKYKAEYERNMRKKRAELLRIPRTTAAAAEAHAKAEFSEYSAQAIEHEGTADGLQTLYATADAARFIISQHLKVLTKEEVISRQDKFHP